jgi:sporulation protein YlmC with PRC-barrel domain
MLYRMERLIGLSIQTSDGELGTVQDVYFDDHRWAARYLVVDAGGWLEEQRVLISPISVEHIDWDRRSVPARLTRQQVKASPYIDTDKPVTRQHEMDLLSYYGCPNYWANGTPPEHKGGPIEPHLRSAREVRSYHLQTTNTSIGYVDDFLIDDESWTTRYIIVDTRDWRPGKHVVISPQWITRVDWAERLITVDVTRDTVQRAPEYDPAIDCSRAYEASLHQHYQRPGYWTR